MCGIALSAGPEADPAIFRRMLAVLAPRGEVTETRQEAGLLAGVRRLRIVDRDRAVQPFTSADGRYVLCYNGEVFNHHELRAELTRAGHLFRTASDTEVVLAAFLRWGARAVHRLRGEWAFAVAERVTGRIYLARDPLGVKPLYWARTPGCLHVASEVKALVGLRAPVDEVPPGHHGWADPDGRVELAAYLDLLALGEGLPEVADPDEAALLVRAAISDSIRMRVDTDLTVGVVLSGGLDSSLALLHVRELHPDCVAVTVGVPDSPDVAYARRLAADLGVPHEVVQLRPRDIRLADVREAIRISELTEYGDIINAVVSVPIFRRLHEMGVKVVLTGDGSDELFGGYPMYHQVGPDRARRLFLHKIRNLCRTELQRVDRASMGYGVEARVPFLDLSVVELAMRLPLALKMRDGQEKWIVRRAFADVLPDYIRRRPKNPMSYSSGLHERARLYKPFFSRLHRRFGYDLLEPVRRDFDSVLTRCGNDLDRAIADGLARPDYTVLEHARDLVGAAKWNAAPLVRRLVGPRPTRGAPVR
ncbi:asparagine synthetase B family protein [Micromonospora purpureochromogenes]|uniref:asparagine synthetase B family protein n=1 Tax=Micromonospora purpureochromogenes TaxID=47872 RepID=UPI003634DC58